jgi:DNA polymerase I-like protein with 3'-5' exonuclease and polymerase domains
VHDEVILEAAPQVAEEVMRWAQRVMVEEMLSLLPGVPIEVEGKVCQHWGESMRQHISALVLVRLGSA